MKKVMKGIGYDSIELLSIISYQSFSRWLGKKVKQKSRMEKSQISKYSNSSQTHVSTGQRGYDIQGDFINWTQTELSLWGTCSR